MIVYTLYELIADEYSSRNLIHLFYYYFSYLGGYRGTDESRQNQACSGEAQRSEGEKGKMTKH